MGITLCFPAAATVTTPNGPKFMKELAVGDVVRVVTPEGRVEWSQVCGWLHKDPASAANYIKLQTSKRQLVVSAEHLVATEEKGRVAFVPAGKLHVGSTLIEVDSTSSAVWGNRIINVSGVQCAGIYAPLTLSGTLIVDGVGASCYAATKSHSTAHAAMKPMRAMYKRNPNNMEAHQGKHIVGSHRYVDILARATGKA